MGSLVDNFRAPTLDTAKWNAVNTAGNSGTQAGGRYTFIVQAGATGDAALVSDAAYDLTGSHIHIELISAGVQEAGLEMYPLILTQDAANQDDSLLIVVTTNLVGIYEVVGGVPNGLAFPAYNAVSMRWWRIREAAGTVYYESAPDVRGPWTTQASVVPTIAITALYAKVRTFDFLALATAKQTAVSNVNYLAPPDVDFPNGAIPIGMEIAFGADLDGDQNAWTWTDVTPPDGESVFMSQEVTVTRGRPDESSDVAPTSADLELDNPDGNFTPDNAASIYYPDVDLGTPARWWIYADVPRLYLRPAYGSNAQVASISSLDLSGDLDVRVDMHMKTTHPSGWSGIVAGRADNGGGYSWRLEVAPDRTVTLFWSDTGTPPANQATSTVPVVPMSARATLRVTLDVDNGAGGHDVKFYIGDEGVNGTFTQVGPTITGAGTTTVANAAEPLIIGSPPDVSEVFALDADVYAFQLRDGIGGTAIVDTDFTAQVSGVSSFVDSTGLLWTINGAAELSNRWFRILGTIDSWKPKWPWGDLSSNQPGGIAEGEARVGLEIAGLLRRLGQGQSPLDSPLRRALTSSPLVLAYWPMEDGKDSTQFASGLVGGSPLTTSGVIDFASTDTLLGSKPLPTLTATSFWSGSVTGVFTGKWQADFYVFVPSPGPGAATSLINVWATPGATVALWIVNISSGAITVQGRNALNVTITTNTTAPTGFFTGWQHVRLMVRQNGLNVEWQLVWFPVTIPPSGGFFFTGSVAGTIGGVSTVSIPVDANLAGVSTGHWSIIDGFDVSLTDGAAIGWAGDTAAERMIRLCAEQGIEFRIIGEADATAQVGVQQIATLLTLLDDAKDADGGILYEMPDAVGLIYRTRDSMYNQPPNMILSALTPHSEVANPFEPIKDDQRIRNDVTVTRTGGSSVQVIDQPSIDKVGIYDESITLNLYTDAQLSDAAGWRLHQGLAPGMRYPSLTSNLGVAPQAIAEWLTCDIGAQVWVTNLPPQHPSGTVRVIEEGYSEPISPTTWVPTMNCSPAGVWDVAVLFGDWVPDEFLLRLDTDGSELTFAVDDNDTTLIVTVTDGPAWTDDNAETPMDIGIGGERITVTDIDPPSGGAEFTGAGDAEDTTPTTSFVAPSVDAPASGDLLICGWCNFNAIDTYTLPGGMFIAAATDGTYTTFEDATQVLGASGATGTRTATFGTSDTWSAVSVVVHSALGTPGVQEFLFDVDTDAGGNAQPVTLTTILPVAAGDWLLAIHAWDWDPGDNMVAPSGSGWAPVADSVIANASTSRIRAWAKRVTVAGIQAVTYGAAAGIDDNHARLYVLTGVTGITQEFTVTRSVNGIVRSHAAGAPIALWFQPVLAR
jgi:hypothetical protein